MSCSCTISRYRCLVFVIAMMLNCQYGYAYHVGEKPVKTKDNKAAPHVVRVTSTYIEFSTSTDGPVQLAIYDVRGNLIPNNGQTIQTIQPVSGKGIFQLNINSQVSGVYFITLSSNDGVTTIGAVQVH